MICDSVSKWREDLRFELSNNMSGCLSSRHTKLAHAIPNTFPDLNLLDLYIRPAVHQDELATNTPLTFSKNPQAIDLAAFATTAFQWGRTAQGIFKRYRDFFFPAMALRELIQASVAIDEGRAKPISCCPMLGKVVGQRCSSETCFLLEIRVLLIIPSQLIREVCSRLAGPQLHEDEIQNIIKDCKKSRAWLPVAMVKVARPDLLTTYKPSSSHRKTAGK